jgi:hypothetical protein
MVFSVTKDITEHSNQKTTFVVCIRHLISRFVQAESLNKMQSIGILPESDEAIEVVFRAESTNILQ